ncbi:methylated-DNA--[protein]-cysteine S-methyltransferase [Pleionea litopenaei]|uniref:methylated-DNA--[protein]-cysteine S-methyltransferase n=1 Tax=Pleionea litopenaei TaxID=3070815 RepID=A0AA51RW59_9GAMM|nr:methylated-DNA--[protein]-cysteine S-methyltransferase [Pleionea sp. HL-JVS1]WMS88610.1 methylated-DNA--[protein]-cysteine S-methyltransferase [Pleionea sp. HL-JVS1]
MNSFIFQSPIGCLTIHHHDTAVLRVELPGDNQIKGSKDASLLSNLSAFQQLVTQQLDEYFKAQRQYFDIPIDLSTTPYRKQVLQALLAIPYGQTSSYGQLADELNSHPRAVGGACRNNPLPILIPCHRVVSKSGIGGFAGNTSGHLIDSKRWLLNLEGTL